MDLKWLSKGTVKVFLEVGLAVVLVVAIGILGTRIGISKNSGTKQEQSQAQKEEAAKENKTAAEDQAQTDEKAQTEGAANPEKAVEEVIAPGQYPIMGNSSVTVEQMVAFFNANGAPYPAEILSKGGADSIEAFCRIFYDEAKAEGVRPEVAFVQTMKETGWLQYGGDASAAQFNFAGIGTTGGGVPGNSYPDVQTGVRAQIQHLKAYATADPLAQACVDDRYEYVTKGCAPYVEWLGQKENPQGYGWATGENYGYSIVEMINKMKNM